MTCPTLVAGDGGLSLDGDDAYWVAIGSGAHVWVAHPHSNINQYDYPGLNFEASINISLTVYGLAADGADTVYWWDFSGSTARLRKCTLGGTPTTLHSELDSGARAGIGFNPYDGLIYDVQSGGPGLLRTIHPSSGAVTVLDSSVNVPSSSQPNFTADGGVWFVKSGSTSANKHVYRWDTGSSTLASSNTVDANSEAFLPISASKVLYRDNVLGATEIDASLALSASSCAPFTSGTGGLNAHTSADGARAVFTYPGESDQLYEMLLASGGWRVGRVYHPS